MHHDLRPTLKTRDRSVHALLDERKIDVKPVAVEDCPIIQRPVVGSRDRSLTSIFVRGRAKGLVALERTALVFVAPPRSPPSVDGRKDG
jgi:hypothetical protein